MTQEVLKQALEALKGLKSMYGGNGHKLHEINMIHRKHDTAITALEEALAQPEQEPVAKYSDIVSDGGLDPRNKFDTTPPQRQWVGLKDDEKSELWGISCAVWPRYITYANVVEAKLKQKNGYAEEKNT